jgi:hypothetical protein
MKYLRFRLWIQVVLLATTLTVSQLFAEQPTQPSADNAAHHDSNNSYVGKGILDVLPQNGAAVKASFPDPSGTVKSSAPGRTYGTLTAILIAAGGAAALAYFLTRPAPPKPPVPTFVSAGTPVITVPAGH